MPRKSIPAIPVGVLRIHGAPSVFRLFRIFNYFFSRAISPSPAGISRALSQSVPISIFHFAVFPRLEEQQRDFVAHKTRPLARAAGSYRDVAVRLAANLFLQSQRKFAQIPGLEANHRPRPRTR